MQILFWNMNNRKLPDQLSALVCPLEIDILIVAECGMSDVEILQSINEGNARPFTSPLNLGSTIRFFTRYVPESVMPVWDDWGVSVRKIAPPLGEECTVVGVHLPSKLYRGSRNNPDQLSHARSVAEVITEAEQRVGHDRTVVIGDFNMNPFEDGLVAADAFHSVMDRQTAAELTRTVDSKKRKYFFNPMWSLLGDASPGPPGTYYYRGSGQICYFWNTFDQVLLRPSLLDCFRSEDLEVITSVGSQSLRKQNGRPNRNLYSDHFPIRLQLTIERP
jgi:hypothetical protein